MEAKNQLIQRNETRGTHTDGPTKERRYNQQERNETQVEKSDTGEAQEVGENRMTKFQNKTGCKLKTQDSMSHQ